jgi:small subunit ribosomal protein S16
MLTLRLARAGTKKRPVFHLVAANRRARRDGRFIESLGYYIPNKKVLVLDQDRIAYWESVGAHVSDTAKELIARSRKRGNVVLQPKPKFEPPPPKPKAAPAEAPKAEATAPESN